MLRLNEVLMSGTWCLVLGAWCNPESNTELLQPLNSFNHLIAQHAVKTKVFIEP